jgi:hypothetical protein
MESPHGPLPRIGTMNQRRPGAIILPKRGNHVSLSSGERAGVRAVFLDTNFSPEVWKVSGWFAVMYGIKSVFDSLNSSGNTLNIRFEVQESDRAYPAVMQHPDFFQRDKAAADHFVQHRQKGIELILAVHNFNHQRQIHGEP